MRLRLRHLACLLALTGALWALPGHTAPHEVVLVTDLWPPFRIESDKDTMKGIDIDLIAQIEKRLDIKIKIVRVPWVRALKMMQDGQADLMSGLARTPERNKFIYYVEPPYTAIRPAFYKHVTTPRQITQYADLASVSIGFTRGSAYFEPFDRDSALQKQAATDESQLLKMLLGRRFDFIIGSDVQVDYEIKLRGYAGEIVKATYQPDKTTPLYFGISRQSGLLMRQAEFAKTVSDLVSEGMVEKILSTYGIGTPEPNPPRH